MSNKSLKKYLIAIIIQVVALTLFVVGNIIGFKNEAVALSPWLFTGLMGAVILILDAAASIFIFKKFADENESPEKKKLDWIKPVIIVVITAILMGTFAVTVYNTVTKPEYYSHFMDLGDKYLQEGRYDEAVIAFNKAIKIDPKSTDARLGLARSCIATGDIETAVRVLKEAQQLDIGNKELLLEMIDILKDVDPDAAYELLKNYIDYIGEANIDEDILAMYNSSQELPAPQIINPPSGTYIKPFDVTLTSEVVRFGHNTYYTTTQAEPNKESARYTGSIRVEENTHFKFITFNQNGISTAVYEADYIIDPATLEKLTNMIDTAQSEIDNTQVGDQVGNCIEGAKEPLMAVLETARALLERNAVSSDEANNMHQQINDALYSFRQKIIVQTDRQALASEIQRAKNLVANASEGNEIGKYRSGAKNALNAEIAAAEAVYKDIIARQETIDAAKTKLTRAINTFESKKITTLIVPSSEHQRILNEANAGSGPVTVSLFWSTTDDLDLHVINPQGQEIYYARERDSYGGILDVDRQVSEFVANPVENIYWSNPPRGTYTVKVDLYSKRSSGSVPFTVRTVVNGQVRTYNLSLSSGRTTVCTFAY